MATEFALEALRPPEHVGICEAAERYRFLNIAGAFHGKYSVDTTPYLREVMDSMRDRTLDSVIFVGPAQTGKTDLFLNWVCYSVMSDPADMLLVEKSQTSARDFSKRRLGRLLQHSKAIGGKLLGGAHSDNVFDKQFLSGMLVTLSWPSISELSGRPIGRVFLSDFDRMPTSIDGEGNGYDLARKRTQTFSNPMTVCESSPGFSITDPKWIRSSLHEAAPCEGILALYNRGDRRRWYWKCPHCAEWFEPDFSLLRYEKNTDPLTAGESAMMLCPKCGFLLQPAHKPACNLAGRWVKDGQWLSSDDQLHGVAHRSRIGSYWLKGVCAAFASWSTLVSRYETALEEFTRTGSQEALRSCTNTDLGEPYLIRGGETSHTADEIKARALPSEDDKPTVPEWTRFLIATVDIQRNRFVVQITGVGPREGGWRMHVVDYWPIVKSNRLDDEDEHRWVRPAAYAEDWFLLRDQVLEKRYPIHGSPGSTMGVAWLGYDTGGAEGVTTNAYGFYREMKRTGAGAHTRLFPLKGDSTPNAPRARIAFPDSGRKDRNAKSRGEIPVLMLNPNVLKDAISGMIDRAAEDSDRTFSWHDALPDAFFEELVAEHRDSKGWTCPRGKRNEAWDLSYYTLGLCVHLKVDRISWDAKLAPMWARPHETNPFVELAAAQEDQPVRSTKQVAKKADEPSSFGKFAENLA
jgi:phage terminase large subunit GpA-like protein